jgi:hypothetical protein
MPGRVTGSLPACCVTPRGSCSQAHVMAAGGYVRIWKERHEPQPLETSVPGYSLPVTSAPAR